MLEEGVIEPSASDWAAPKCVVLNTRFSDVDCRNQVPYKSLSDIQAHVLASLQSGRSSCAKPIDDVTIQQIQQELAAQGPDSGGKGKEARSRLVEHLEGLQSVPLLLINNPRADIQELHLEHLPSTIMSHFTLSKGI